MSEAELEEEMAEAYWSCPICQHVGEADDAVEIVEDETESHTFPNYSEPDYNVIDISGDNEDAIFAAVLKAFSQYDPEIIKRIFETKRIVLQKIIETDGRNDWKMPHWRAKTS